MRYVGVNVRRQTRVGVAHQFLREALRNAAGSEFGGEGVAQGVKIDFTAHGVDSDEACRVEVFSNHAVGVEAARKNKLRQIRRGALCGLEGFEQTRVKRKHSLAAVLRRNRARDDVRALVVENQIAPHELPQFAQTQARVSGRQIKQAVRPRDGQEAVEFVVGEGAAALLLAAHVNARDFSEDVARDAALAFHPVEERVHGVEVFVHGLGREGRLPRPPRDEAIHGNVADVFPSALVHELERPRVHLTAINFAAPQGGEVGHKVRQMVFNGPLRGVALKLGRDEARALTLFFFDDFGELVLRHLLVRGAQRNVGNGEIAREAEAASVGAAGFNFAVHTATGFENVGDHKNGGWACFGIGWHTLAFPACQIRVLARSIIARASNPSRENESKTSRIIHVFIRGSSKNFRKNFSILEKSLSAYRKANQGIAHLGLSRALSLRIFEIFHS